MENIRRKPSDVFGRVSPIQMMIQIHAELSVALLGVLTGALLIAGVPLVGFWQSLEPQTFVDIFTAHTQRIGSMLVPLSIIAVVFTALSAGALTLGRSPNSGWFVSAAVLALIVAGSHPFYADLANDAFAAASSGSAEAAQRLSSLRNWQWLRVAFAFAALISSIRGLRTQDLDVLASKPAPRRLVTALHR
jgi:hypothetical protein